LSDYAELYQLFNEDGQLKVKHCIENDDIGKTVGWFVKPSLDDHAKDIENWISGDQAPSFTIDQFTALLEISDSDEWQSSFCRIVSLYYGKSSSYIQADARYQESVPNFIKFFDRDSLIYLAEKIESNSQCHDRYKARSDYVCIKKQIDEKFVEEFEYENYKWFTKKLDLDK
jgi:hypothetical protein